MLPESASSDSPGRFSYDGLDRAFHEKARLGILTSLLTNQDGLSFGELKDLCSLTDGNLNRHLKMLAEAELVEQVRHKGAGRPRTHCRLTQDGRDRFLAYLAELERVVRDGLASRRPRSSAPRPSPLD